MVELLGLLRLGIRGFGALTDGQASLEDAQVGIDVLEKVLGIPLANAPEKELPERYIALGTSCFFDAWRRYWYHCPELAPDHVEVGWLDRTTKSAAELDRMRGVPPVSVGRHNRWFRKRSSPRTRSMASSA